MCDTEQRFVLLNAAACEAMGGSEESLLGRTFLDVTGFSDGTRAIDRHMRLVAETGRPMRDETYSQATADPDQQAWDVEMWPLRDTAAGWSAPRWLYLDSTEQHHARRRLALLDEATSALGTTLDVVRTAEELVALLVPTFADFAAVDLLDWVLDAEAPPLRGDFGVVMRRVAHASAYPDAPATVVPLGRTDVYPPYSPPARALRGARRCSPGRASRTSTAGWPSAARSPSGRPGGRRHRPRHPHGAGRAAARPRHHARRRDRRPQRPPRRVRRGRRRPGRGDRRTGRGVRGQRPPLRP